MHNRTVIIPNKYTNENIRVNPILIASVGSVFVLIGWNILILSGEDVIASLRQLSGKFRSVELNSNILLPFLIIASLAAHYTSILLFQKKWMLFIVILFLSIALSDVKLPTINAIAFVLRYVFLLTLIALGFCELFYPPISKYAQLLRRLSYGYLSWIIISLIINRANASALAMLPMQLAMFMGIIIGMPRVLEQPEQIRQIFRLLAWLGVALALFHASALILNKDAYLGGRFRSYFILPTNFSNPFSLFIIIMLWRALDGQRLAVSALMLGFSLLGIALVFLSGTRNAMLAVAVGFISFGYIWRIKVSILVLAGIIAGAFVIALALQDSHVFEVLSERMTSSSTESRQHVWALTWEFIRARPFFGYGMGKGVASLSTHLAEWELATYINAHNAYLGIWLQLGIVGLIFILSFYFLGLVKGISLLAKRDKLDVEISIVPFALLLSLAAAGLFEENLTSRGSLYQAIWSFSIACLISLDRNIVRKD